MTEQEKSLIRKIHSVNISKYNFFFALVGLVLLLVGLLF